MTARITTDTFCDICGDWTHGVVSNRVKVHLSREIARRSGWQTRVVNGKLIDICPRCVKAAFFNPELEK